MKRIVSIFLLLVLSPERDSFVAILDGVKIGDRIVVNPGDQIRDGVPVK